MEFAAVFPAGSWLCFMRAEIFALQLYFAVLAYFQIFMGGIAKKAFFENLFQ